MPANTDPIFTLVPNIGRVAIPTATAQVKSNGVSAGSAVDFVYKAFTAGANGSYVTEVRFYCVASAAATASVATTLRAYLSTISSPGATTAADTFLLGEVGAPSISASHSTIATGYLVIPIFMAIPTGTYIHVSQHVAQTANQNWNANVIGGDY